MSTTRENPPSDEDYLRRIERGYYYQSGPLIREEIGQNGTSRQSDITVEDLRREVVGTNNVDEQTIELMITIWKIVLGYVMLLLGTMIFIAILTFVMLETDVGMENEKILDQKRLVGDTGS